MSVAATLVEMLMERSREGGRPFLTLVGAAGERRITAREIWHGALASAAGLQALGLRQRDRLMLLVPNGLAFVETLFGALLLGVVPVIYPPPHSARSLPRYLRQLSRIAGQCRPWGAVLDEAALQTAGTDAFEGLRLIAPPKTEATLRGPNRPDSDEAAIVQYSSGSTGEPKGAVLTHRAILANGRAIGRAIGGVPDDVMLSWLPLCHDMGLFGGLIFAWLHGWQSVHLEPHAFLVEPSVWLRAISRYQATITIAPNFAYSLCVHGVEPEELAGVDLSSLRVAFNGAEPISRRATEGFLSCFEPYGFRPEALFPVYGMAENTLAVAFPPLGRGPRFDRIVRSALEVEGKAVPAALGDPDAKDVASVGRPLDGVQLCVLDEKSERLPERMEGQIAIRGTSLMSGYLNHPEATAESVRDGWLHTGDRGYLAGGELHVTGRQSDLILRAGRNLHPQDLEAVVEPLTGVRRGCVVAGGLRDRLDATEDVALLVETKLGPAESAALQDLAGRIRSALLDALGVAPERVVLLEPRTLPKTSSGKLQRRLALRLYAEGELRPIHGG
jgi:acyl-CoA synthetase (AMP-forming)/AMP-acid ligase II